MSAPWNNSELARLSADLDEELDAIFNRVEESLALEDVSPEADELAAEDAPAFNLTPAAPAELLAGDDLLGVDFDISVAASVEEVLEPKPAAGRIMADETWIEPGLLGEPEVAPAGLTPEMVRELSRIIEAAVERGVAAALEKIRR